MIDHVFRISRYGVKRSFFILELTFALEARKRLRDIEGRDHFDIRLSYCSWNLGGWNLDQLLSAAFYFSIS